MGKRKVSWAAEEFSGADFGDERLRRRLVTTAERLSSQPTVPINQACGKRGTKGAYRLFNNQKVKVSAMLASHQEKTRERVQEHAVVLAIQDTTYLNYSTHVETQGLGQLGKLDHTLVEGLAMHTTLAVNCEGTPLGLLDQEIWARQKKGREGEEHKSLRIEEKESHRWLRALERTVQIASSETQVVTVGDREADIYEFIVRAISLQTSFLIRAAWDRRVSKPDKEELTHLWSALSAQPVAGEFTVEVPSRGINDKPRTATVGVAFSPINLSRPKRLEKLDTALPSEVSVVAILARELKPPAGCQALEWMLLTNLSVQNGQEAIERVGWYRLRWTIEIYHKILKSGFKVEDCRLETADRLERYLTLCSILAWRLHYLTQINREQPDVACDCILAKHEWQALYCKSHAGKSPPKKPPTIREAIRMIAQLGGFLARKGDGQPGITTLWRGWKRLNDIAEDWLLFRGKRCG